jgi:hypothetical protein
LRAYLSTKAVTGRCSLLDGLDIEISADTMRAAGRSIFNFSRHLRRVSAQAQATASFAEPA